MTKLTFMVRFTHHLLNSFTHPPQQLFYLTNKYTTFRGKVNPHRFKKARKYFSLFFGFLRRLTPKQWRAHFIDTDFSGLGAVRFEGSPAEWASLVCFPPEKNSLAFLASNQIHDPSRRFTY